MPSFNFVLPHWMYWGGLLIFPLVAMYLVARQRRHGVPREPIMFNAYLFWLTSGFMGLHRMYLKSWWGFAYVPFFLAVLYCNGEVREVARRRFAHDLGARAGAVGGQARASARRRRADARGEQDARRRRGRHARQAGRLRRAKAVQDHWKNLALAFALVVAVLLVADAFLLPALVRRRRAEGMAAGYAADPVTHEPEVQQQGTGEDPTLRMHTPLTGSDRADQHQDRRVRRLLGGDLGLRLLLRG